jgi:glycosyltransferase involved in cell wall biosynthesis/GT2 family glycosyltransferase
MARVAIVSYDVQTIHGKSGGVGAFTTRWAEMLRRAGDDVTIVMTRTDRAPMSVDAAWRSRYQMSGIKLIELQAPPPGLPIRWPELPTMRMAEIVAPVLKGFDIVYVQDWANSLFHLVRERRYSVDQGPVCVTVLHGPSEWELAMNERYPKLPDDLHLGYQERYAAKHSDFVVSPSRYMVQQLSKIGWEFPGEVEVLGLPMPLPAAEPALPAPQIKKVLYFGRIEERKGIKLFVKALQEMAKHTTARPNVVLLGSTHHPELLEFAEKNLKTAGYSVKQIASLDSEGAAKYLRDHATETLCVVPSPSDNFPYAIVEASMIPGLNLIACRGGGVPEILRDADEQLSEPHFRDLAAKILELLQSPLSAADLTHYDATAAEERWLTFHRRALASIQTRTPRALPATKLTVDVVSTYYQKAPHLPQFVDALEQQTDPDFHVIAVNDGSPDEASNTVFEAQAARVASRGWDFFRQENTFVDKARNNAAARGQGELILFVDADDVPARNAVERMRNAMTLSGADALICGSFLFASDSAPYKLQTGETTVPAYATCVPLGINLVGGMVDPASFGGSMFIVRRSAFEAIGGFSVMRGAGHEDWELYVRLALAGYDVDVVPDLLQFYRQVEGSLARTLGSEASKRRLLDAYEERMAAAGLAGGARALAGLYAKSKEMDEQMANMQARIKAPQGGFAFFTAGSNRFDSDFQSGLKGRLQDWYRRSFSMETRLKIHRVLLSPFVGHYEPPVG